MLLEATDLRKSYPIRRNAFGRVVESHHAVAGVDLRVAKGETVAVVGESGAGKSTLGRMLLRLIEPDGGQVHLDGIDVLALSKEQLRRTRARMQMVFQDPFSSLDPKMTIGDSVGEPLLALKGMGRDERHDLIGPLLRRVGISEAMEERYPHELSGGQLQRVAIARAIATGPDLIVCDEPVAALDVSIRAQVLNLLREIQREQGISYVFVSHDLGLVSVLAHRVVVMQHGRVVEEGTAAQIFEDPQEDYTKALLAAIPLPDPATRRRPLPASRTLR